MAKAAVLLFALLTSFSRFAAADTTGLPVPRFVSLRSNQINLRTGPGMRYPVEITAEFENWRKIKDWDGKEGWVHQHMLSGRRTIRLNKETLLLRAPADEALPVAKAEAGVIGKLELCPKNVAFCKVNLQGFQGWLPKKELWGVYPAEVYE